MAPKKKAKSASKSWDSQSSTATHSEMQKIRVARETDDELVERFEEYGECSITWVEPPKRTKIVPPPGTVAVVVDVPKDKGAIRIHEEASGLYVGGVGTEDAGFMVIVIWDESLWFRVAGSLRVGYITVL